jgi:hypothetical protein
MKNAKLLVFCMAIAAASSQASEELDRVCLEEARQSFARIRFREDDVVTSSVRGIQISDYSGNVAFAKSALQGMDLKQPKYQECRDALCLLTQASGSEEIALRTLSIYHFDGYIVKFKNKHAGRSRKDFIWEKNTIRSLQEGLDLLPARHRPDSAVLKFFYSTPGTTNYFNQGTRVIDLTPQADTGVVLHEIGHAMSMNNFFSDVFNLRIITGDNKRTSYRNAYALDKRAKHSWGFNRSKEEDYANAFAYYVMAGEEMKQTAPNRHQFLKERVFQNQELPEVHWQEFQKLMTQEIKATLLMGCFEDVRFLGNRTMADAQRRWQSLGHLSCFDKNLSLLKQRLESRLAKRMYCFKQGDEGLAQWIQRSMANELGVLFHGNDRLVNKSRPERFRELLDRIENSAKFNEYTPDFRHQLAELLSGLTFI